MEMEDTKLTINLNLTYESISIPQKIVIPVNEGKFGLWRYKQHKTDPLSVEKIKFGYVGEDRIKINMMLTGRIDVNNFPDIIFGGTKVRIDAGMIIENSNLCILDPKLTNLDLPNVPNFADNILRDILNKNLAKLTDGIKVDLQKILENTRRQLNKSIPFKIKLNKEKYDYELRLNIEPIEPEFKINPQGIRLKLYMILKPTVTRVEQANA